MNLVLIMTEFLKICSNQNDCFSIFMRLVKLFYGTSGTSISILPNLKNLKLDEHVLTLRETLHWFLKGCKIAFPLQYTYKVHLLKHIYIYEYMSINSSFVVHSGFVWQRIQRRYKVFRVSSALHCSHDTASSGKID